MSEHQPDDAAEEVGPPRAADFLDTSVEHILELIELEALPARRNGAMVFIRTVDLVAYRDEQARRRSGIREINRIGAQQMANERLQRD